MQKLPVGLISRTFVDCLPASQFIRPDIRSPPLQLTGVCSQWREIALSTPLLWSSLDTTRKPGTTVRGIYPADKARYKEWLSRSGRFDISLSVAFEAFEEEEYEKQFWTEDWMRFVDSYGSRFRRLQVADECGVNWDYLLWCNDKLEYFSLQSRSKPHSTLECCSTFPCLKTLVLDQVVVEHSTLRSTQWHIMTHLTVKLPDEQTCSMDDFFEVLCFFRELQALLYGRITHNFAEVHYRLDLPRLRLLTLVVSNVLEDEQPLFFPDITIWEQQHIRLPVLDSLRVQRDFPRGLEDALWEEIPGDSPGSEHRCKMILKSHLAFRIVDPGWARLRHLELRFEGRFYVLSTVLSLCPVLRTLHLTGHHCDTQSTSLLDDFGWWPLTEMYLSVDAEIGDLFQKAKSPRLRVLCIDTVHCGRRRDILEMLMRSGCPLDRIQLKESRRMGGWTKRSRDKLAELLRPSTIIDIDVLNDEDGDEDECLDLILEEEEEEEEEECFNKEDVHHICSPYVLPAN